MPTISQLPPAGPVSAADEIPISQSGSVCAISVGTLLAATQPAILVETDSLLGRISLGQGGPEPIEIGLGIDISNGTLVADGLDHAAFSLVSSLPIEADVVISNQGTPMLMQAALLRQLFSAGQNVDIDANGIISVINAVSSCTNATSGSFIESLHVVTTLSAEDLVAVSQSGADCAITYGSLLDGVTIDQAAVAGPAVDSDSIWVGQGSNVMTRQDFSAIWAWIKNKLPTYTFPVIEITTNTSLDAAVHNGHLLICSQAVTLLPLADNMGSGFQCTVINASSGNIVLGSGFVSSSGSLSLAPRQSATLSCLTYSGGTIAFAAMP